MNRPSDDVMMTSFWEIRSTAPDTNGIWRDACAESEDVRTASQF